MRCGEVDERSLRLLAHLEDSGHADELIEGCGRIPSMVLSSLITEAYPELEQSSRMRNASSTEYKKRYK
jgi:hypothetical protein